MELFYKAEILHKHCSNISMFVKEVRFHGVANSKVDSLKKEVSNLYFSQNLDELIKDSFLAAQHMQVRILS